MGAGRRSPGPSWRGARATSPTASPPSASDAVTASPSSARRTWSGSSRTSGSSAPGRSRPPSTSRTRPQDCRYILEDSGARFIFCDSGAQVAKIREVTDRLPRLEGIIRAQGPAADGFERTLAELERPGRELAQGPPGRARGAAWRRWRSTTPACFIYTSGTTGNAEGRRPHPRELVYEAEAVESIREHHPTDDVVLLLPPDGALVREGDRRRPGSRIGCRRRLRRVAREDHGQRRGGPADGDAVRPAHLREGLRRRGLEGARPRRAEGEALHAGDAGLRRLRRGARAGPGPRGPRPPVGEAARVPEARARP